MLLTLANLKTRLAISNSADDTALTALITQISAQVAKYCDRVLEREVAAVEYHNPRSFITLEHYPVEALALYEDSERDFSESTLLVEDEDYVYKANNGHIYLLCGLSTMPYSIKAIVTGGYVAAGSTPGAGQTAIPDDITLAILQQCEFVWKNHPEFGRQSINLQGQSVSVASFGLLDGVKDILNRYRRLAL